MRGQSSLAGERYPDQSVMELVDKALFNVLTRQQLDDLCGSLTRTLKASYAFIAIHGSSGFYFVGVFGATSRYLPTDFAYFPDGIDMYRDLVVASIRRDPVFRQQNAFMAIPQLSAFAYYPFSFYGEIKAFVLVCDLRERDFDDPWNDGIVRKLLADTASDAEAIVGRAIDDISGVDERKKRREPEVASEFLIKTLVHKPVLHNHRSLAYLTLKKWRTPIAKYQIAALRAAKRGLPDELVFAAAEDIHGAAVDLLGDISNRLIVPVPCGHSVTGPCFSRAIAIRLADISGGRFRQVFEAQPQKGSSHPKTNVNRPPMKLINPPANLPIIIVDDVVTSGSHISEATHKLRRFGNSVTSIGWIGGETGKD